MAYPWGDEIGKDNANCNGCGTQWDNTQTAPVGSFASNRFNLYDMAGNIWELVEDCAHDNYDGAPNDGSAWIEAGNCKSRVARGGAWSNTPDFLRAAARVSRALDVQNSNLGFRVGRTLGD
jgi:formylglycine-generating enzyme required for sulfatase activity